MKLALAVLALAAVTSADIKSVEDLTLFGYHQKIGIPEANRIRSLEQNGEVVGTRIVGGTPTDISEIPYQVGLIITVMYVLQSVCGGALISRTAVLTAAHCYYDGLLTAQNFTVVAGSNTLFSGGQRVGYAGVVVHPFWYPNEAQNDVAIIKTYKIQFNNLVQPISLPTKADELPSDYVGFEALASGYGLTRDGGSMGSLSSVWSPILSINRCKDVWGPWFRNTNVCVSGEGGKSTCSGDSGGPLAILSVNRQIMIVFGVASFGSQNGCERGLPPVFTRVTTYRSWISYNLNERK